MTGPVVDIESPLREIIAIAALLQTLGASERNIARDTIYVLGTLIEDAANDIEVKMEAALKAAGPEAARAAS